MGILGKLKDATSVVTGGAAKVSIEYPMGIVFPGEPFAVKVTVMATKQLKSKGIFVDVVGTEQGHAQGTVKCNHCGQNTKETIPFRKDSTNQSFPIAPALEMQANETRTFDASIQLPGGAPPSYSGPVAHHEWRIRGRVQAFGNDPDSGYQAMRVGLKS